MEEVSAGIDLKPVDAEHEVQVATAFAEDFGNLFIRRVDEIQSH